jgi:protein phosphatase
VQIKVPELALVLMVGASGSGKSTFAKKHFREHEVVSSDLCRGMVSNDENSLEATNDAFALLHYLTGLRLKRGLLTVIDATNVQAYARKQLIALAREHHVLAVAIVLNVPADVCEARNAERADRNFGKHVIRQHAQQLKKSLRGLRKEGFQQIYVLNSEQEIDSVVGISREKLYNDKKSDQGPFDIIGDIHGCFDETVELLGKLGYQVVSGAHADESSAPSYGFDVTHPSGRKAVFVGDLVDRGPASPAVLKLVMSMVHSGVAYCVPGNHDIKLQKHLKGRKVSINHGLEETIEQLKAEPDGFKHEVREFIYSLISHLVFDDGKLVVAHAGIREEMQGRGSGAIRSFCLYGETTGEIDEFGLPVRYNWASEYRGQAKVVYGHTPVPHAEWLNRTIDIDTGCVFGGKLTALRYPEEELVSVNARAVYCEPVRPVELSDDSLSHQHEYDDVLDIADVTGKRIVQTRLRHNITLQEENSIAALEVMSRWAINPKWLIYLPPTMAPCGTSERNEFLEHPDQAINYYRKRGVKSLVCEEKHMGSRAILIVCKDASVVKERFGLVTDAIGICYTRTGRNFFTNAEMETLFLARVQAALHACDFWSEHNTDWVCLDAELMPWSAKAQSLLKDQYASVSAAASHSLSAAESALRALVGRGFGNTADELLQKVSFKSAAVEKFSSAYQNYCWDVTSVEDYKLAPFHIMATEGEVHCDKSHAWHMQQISKICEADSTILRATPYRLVDTDDQASVQSAVDWWLALTEKGGEGMVVKPLEFVSITSGGDLLQPAVKCRGPEYLRIIYGPEYDLADHLAALKQRGLSRKRSLALREFALGVEGLERFVRKEPLRRVHESVFGVLALESESVDPRL